MYGKYPGLENANYNFFLSTYFNEYYNLIIPAYVFSQLMSIETVTRARRKVHEKMRLKGWVDKKSLEKEEQKQKIITYIQESEGEYIEEKIIDMEDELVQNFGLTPKEAQNIMKEKMNDFVDVGF